MTATLNVRDVADQLGHTTVWLYRNWQRLRTQQGFPPPIVSEGKLVWSRLHVEAWLDRGLDPKQRRIVQALRLAEAALSSGAASEGAALTLEALWRERFAATHAEDRP